MTTCPWYVRWWHEMKREIDWKRLTATPLTPLDSAQPYGETLRNKAWDEMEQRPHWNCPCASQPNRPETQ